MYHAGSHEEEDNEKLTQKKGDSHVSTVEAEREGFPLVVPAASRSGSCFASSLKTHVTFYLKEGQIQESACPLARTRTHTHTHT